MNIAILLLFASLLCLPSFVFASTYAANQISAFTQSRPGTERIMDEGQEVYKFLLRAFDGAYTSVPLAWDPSEPNDNAYAEHKPSVSRRFINIRVSSRLSPHDQVACMVYEAINAQNERQFSEITEKAHNGSMTKTEFIHNILRLEHKSLKKTRAFLADQDPYKNIDLSHSIFYSKMSGTPDKFDDFLDYLQQIKRKEYDVFKHYSDFYDFVIPPTRRWEAKQKELAVESQIKTPAKEEKTP